MTIATLLLHCHTRLREFIMNCVVIMEQEDCVSATHVQEQPLGGVGTLGC